MATTNELIAFYESKLRALSCNEDELVKLSRLVDQGKKQIAEDHLALLDKDKVIKQLTDKVADLSKSLEDIKRTTEVELAAVKADADLAKDQAEKQMTDLLAAQSLAAREFAELKSAYLSLEEFHDRETKRLRLSRVTQVVQARRDIQTEASAKLAKVRRHVEDRDRADPIIQRYGQAKGTLNCIRLIVAEGGVVPAAIVKRLEEDFARFKRQFDDLDIADVTSDDFRLRPEFNEYGSNLNRPAPRS